MRRLTADPHLRDGVYHWALASLQHTAAQQGQIHPAHGRGRTPAPPFGRRPPTPRRLRDGQNPDLFHFQPSTFSPSPPRTKVSKTESKLVVSLSVPQDDADAAKIGQQIDGEVKSTENYLGWIRDDCTGWNSGLLNTTTRCVRARKRRLLEQDNLIGQVGIPLRRREGTTTSSRSPTSTHRPRESTSAAQFAHLQAIEPWR